MIALVDVRLEAGDIQLIRDADVEAPTWTVPGEGKVIHRRDGRDALEVPARRPSRERNGRPVGPDIESEEGQRERARHVRVVRVGWRIKEVLVDLDRSVVAGWCATRMTLSTRPLRGSKPG